MNNYRLQLRSHKEIFLDRQTAIDYINNNFRPDSLIGEPAVSFYGTSSEPKMILAIGLGKSKIAFIDIDNVEKNIATLLNDNDLNKEDLVNVNSQIKELISSCGLEFDDNKVKFKITYKPGDELISSAKSISEAINILCGEVKKGKTEFNLNTKSSDTIEFKLERNILGDGKTLTGSVNLSNDNSIIYSKENNGIKANIDITCTEDGLRNNNLTVRIGNKTKDVKLPGLKIIKDAQYLPNNKIIRINSNDGNHIDIDVSEMVQTWIIDSTKNKGPVVLHRESELGKPDKLYAELKLGSGNNLIKKDLDNNISVNETDIAIISGKISDEKDKVLERKINEKINETNTNLSNLDTEVKNNKVLPGETNTVSTKITEKQIKSDVKISDIDDNIVKALSDGLYAKANLTYNAKDNILSFDNGICPIDITLRDKNNISNIYYDNIGKDLVFVYSDGCDSDTVREERISLCDLYNDFEIVCDRESPIMLHKQIKTCGKDVLTAELNISDNIDNLLEVVDGALFASKMAYKHFMIWKENGVNSKISIQEALDRLKKATEDNALGNIEIGNLKKLIEELNKLISDVRKDLGNKTDEADANGSAFGRIESLKEDIDALNKDDSDVYGEYVSSVTQEKGIINVNRQKIPINAIDEEDKILSIKNNNIKANLSLSVDDGPQSDGERYLRLKGLNGQEIDKISLDFASIKTIDCGEY